MPRAVHDTEGAVADALLDEEPAAQGAPDERIVRRGTDGRLRGRRRVGGRGCGRRQRRQSLRCALVFLLRPAPVHDAAIP